MAEQIVVGATGECDTDRVGTDGVARGQREWVVAGQAKSDRGDLGRCGIAARRLWCRWRWW